MYAVRQNDPASSPEAVRSDRPPRLPPETPFRDRSPALRARDQAPSQRKGEALWTTPRGPNKVSLEACDLGKGAGIVDGAFAEMPRYFADAERVMDVETRILWCMEKLQGFSHADLVKKPHPAAGQPIRELGAIATYVANKSSGMRYAAKLDSAKARDAV